jgi:ATP-binding cassette subfamily B protein
MRALRTLYALLTRERRRQLLLTLVLMLVAAAAEIVTIGAVVPFLALAVDTEARLMPAALMRFAGATGLAPVAAAALLLGIAAVFAAGVRLRLALAIHRAAVGLGHDIASAVFGRALRRPYAEHVRQNSAATVSAVEQVQRVVMGALLPALQGIVAAILALVVLLLLLSIDARAAGIAAAFAGAAYLAVSVATAGRLARNAKVLAENAAERTRSVQEGLGGIRDIILEGAQGAVEARFRRVDERFRRAQALNAFIATTPRYVVEAAGVVALVAVVLAASARGSIVAAVPVLGALALGAQRLLPLLQTAWHGWSAVRGNLATFEQLLGLMDMPAAPAPAPAVSRAGKAGPLLLDRLEFRGVSYRHPGGDFGIGGASFRIEAGEHVAVVGPTGAGKSTLLDLMMGLLEPQDGEIGIDGTLLTPALAAHWQAQLAHVPQLPYLVDESIAANIAFPSAPGEIDPAALAEAVRAAQLEPFLATLADGLETRVGERGVRLSAGQRQRIGLARALARRPRLLILDEATSALDDETEAAVLAALHAMEGLTLVVVAHRASSIAHCTRVIEVAAGTVRER